MRLKRDQLLNFEFLIWPLFSVRVTPAIAAIRGTARSYHCLNFPSGVKSNALLDFRSLQPEDGLKSADANA